MQTPTVIETARLSGHGRAIAFDISGVRLGESGHKGIHAEGSPPEYTGRMLLATLVDAVPGSAPHMAGEQLTQAEAPRISDRA